MSGYSWRLVEVKELEVAMLNDVVEITQSIEEPTIIKSGWKAQAIMDAAILTANAPKSTGWGQPAFAGGKPIQQASPVSQPASSDLQHGLSGSVWLVHHKLRIKTRVSADKVDVM